jgi:hypothetical protein
MCSGFSISGRMAARRLRAVDSSRDAGHSVWLFGDTFVGDPAHGSRVNSALVPNTVGISSCRGNDWSIYYYLGKDGASGTARPILDTGTDQFRYWPLDGFLEAQRLYVFLVDTAITGNRPFDFEAIGASRSEVTNPQAEPDRWNIQYRRLSPDAGLAVGVSAVVQFPYVYLYAVADRIAPGKHQVILARLPLDRLDSPATSVEYLSARGTWKKGLDQKDARVLVDAGAPDFSVRFHPALWKWVMVQTDSAFPAREIGIRTRIGWQVRGRRFARCMTSRKCMPLRGPLTSSVMRQRNTLSFQRRQTH